MNISTRIRVARQRARLSQEQLALALGVSRGAVANWECVGNVLPAAARLEKLARVTGTAYEWLATGRGPIAFASSEEETLPGAEVVHDAQERRLLSAFRLLGTRDRQRIIASIEADLPSWALRNRRRLP